MQKRLVLIESRVNFGLKLENCLEESPLTCQIDINTIL
jgi:hypothetical protein